MLTLEMIQDAKKTLEGVARVTPLYESAFINPNANVFIKCENMQVTGSFKLRGAYVKTASLTEEEASKGVIACSAPCTGRCSGSTEKRHQGYYLHARRRSSG